MILDQMETGNVYGLCDLIQKYIPLTEWKPSNFQLPFPNQAVFTVYKR